MRRLPILFITFIAGLFFTAPASVQACSCIGSGAPCQTFWNTEAVFSGEVKAITDFPVQFEGGGSAFVYQQKLVQFAVGEQFRGVSEDAVEVITGQGGGDCGFHFEVGQSYLVYAYKNQATGKLGTGICTRTQLLSKAAEDIEYFRSLPSAKSGATIFGKVVKRFVRKDDDAYREPARGF